VSAIVTTLKGCVTGRGILSTSLGTLLVRHGGLNSDVMFLPTIAPATVRGKCTNKKIAIMSWRE
jgi:hypothetical protein